MIRTIYFDFGNVLAFFDHLRAIKKLLRFTDLPAAELTLVLYGGALEDDFEQGRLTSEQYFAAVQADGRLRCSHDEFVAAFVDIFWENEPVTALVPRLKKHHRLVLASNTNAAHFTQYRRQFAHVLDHFDHFVVSHEVGARKPHRAFYEHCQRYAGCEPRECIFIDDLPSNVAAAEAFGWKGVVLDDPDALAGELRRLGVRGLDDGRPPVL
jgi:HAD superfamily hydrolase (TIGR01509 family)